MQVERSREQVPETGLFASGGDEMRDGLMRGVWGLAIVALTPWPVFGAPAAHVRSTTVFEEYIEGARQPSSSAERAIQAALITRGLTLVDEAQAVKIRTLVVAETLLADGTLPGELTALDADVIIAGVSRISPVDSKLLAGSMGSFAATVELRLIAVDTGRVLGALKTTETALGLNRQQAAVEAAERAGKALAGQVADVLSKRGSRMTVLLTVAGLPSLGETDRVLTGLRALPGVEVVTAHRAARKLSRFSVELSGLDAEAFARAVEESEQVGLDVLGLTAHELQASYAPKKALKLALVVSPLGPSGAGPTWKGQAIAGVLAAELDSSGVFNEVRGPTNPRTTGSVAPRTLLLTGGYRELGRELHVELQLATEADGRVIHRAQTSCPRDRWTACVTALGERVAKALPVALARQRLLEGAGLPVSARRSSGPIEVSALEVVDVIPSQLARYAIAGVGKVRLKNTGRGVLDEVTVIAEVVGLTRQPVAGDPVKIPRGATREISIRVDLDPRVLAERSDNAPAVLRLRVTGRAGEQAFVVSRSRTLMVYQKNALTWADPRAVAAFVTPRSPAVLALNRAIQRLIPSDRAGEALPWAAGILRAVAAARLSYLRDPSDPFRGDGLDFVQYPAETLAARGGDCDDLSVLIAALAEAGGHRALLVAMPGHIMPALGTGIPARNAHLLTVDRARLIEHEGQLWLPLEPTLIGRSLKDAWSAAASQLSRVSKKELQLVDLRGAWREFAPSEPPGTAVVTEPSLPSSLTQQVGHDVAEVEAAHRAEAERALLALEPGTAASGQRTLLLLSLGRVAEARLALEAERVARGSGARPENNLGNLELLVGEAARAVDHYDAALASAPKDARIHMNAALAAWMAGDERRFGEHVLSCVDLGAKDLVLDLEALVRGLSPEAKGLPVAGQSLLADDLLRVLGGGAGTQRLKGALPGSAAIERRALVQYVFWL